jgi:hypothetical protein
MSLEQDFKKGEALAKAATAALGAYAPLAVMGIDAVKWLVGKLKDKSLLSPADLAEYEANMATWQANIDAAQAHVDEFNALRAAEQAPKPDNTLPATPQPKTPNSLSTD